MARVLVYVPAKHSEDSQDLLDQTVPYAKGIAFHYNSRDAVQPPMTLVGYDPELQSSYDGKEATGAQSFPQQSRCI